MIFAKWLIFSKLTPGHKVDKILIKIKYVIRNIKRINNVMYWKEDVSQT